MVAVVVFFALTLAALRTCGSIDRQGCDSVRASGRRWDCEEGRAAAHDTYCVVGSGRVCFVCGVVDFFCKPESSRWIFLSNLSVVMKPILVFYTHHSNLKKK